MKKAIIFDMDGVLVDTEVFYIEEIQKFLVAEGIVYDEATLNTIVGSSVLDTNKIIYSFYDHKISFDEFVKRFTKVSFPKTDYYKLKNPDIEIVFPYLKAHKYKIALASSSPMHVIETICKECKILEYFDCIVSGEMFQESKPNPEIYEYTAKQLQISPQECLVVEDSPYGIEAAKNAGMFTVALKETRFSFSQEKADKMISKLSDLLPLLDIES